MQKELTPREQIILDLLVKGLSPKEIAHKLNISERTVSFHRGNIYSKLGVHSIQELLAKCNSAGDTGAAISAEQEAALYVNRKNKKLKPLILLGILIFAVYNLFNWRFFIKPSGEAEGGSSAPAGKPLTLILNDNEPWGYSFFYPFLFNETKITKDDIYTIKYSFVSNVDIGLLYVFFLDMNDAENQFNNKLSPNAHIKGNIKANVEYNGLIAIIAAKTSSSTDPNANLLVIDTMPYTGSQPTLTFSRFEIIKNN